MLTLVAANLQRVRARIARATSEAGRPADSVRLIAVTKAVGPSCCAQLAELGQLDFGENRVDQLEAKSAALSARLPLARWHLIGHLQRNKARRALSCAHSVH